MSERESKPGGTAAEDAGSVRGIPAQEPEDLAVGDEEAAGIAGGVRLAPPGGPVPVPYPN